MGECTRAGFCNFMHLKVNRSKIICSVDIRRGTTSKQNFKNISHITYPVSQPISRDLRRELYSRRRGDGVPKRKSRKEAKEMKEAKEAKEGNKENQKATPPPTESKSNVAVKKAGKC